MRELVEKGRNSRVMVYRRPWYWLIVLSVIALVTSGLIAEGARTRIAGETQQFSTAQQLRLQRVEQRVDGYFGDAEALVRMGTQTFAHIYDDRNLTAWLVRQMFRGRRNLDVFSMGIVYAPYRFESKSKFVCFYERSNDGTPLGRFDTRWNKDIIDVRAFGDERSGFDYTHLVWFQHAVALKGQLGYSGPYRDGWQSYISTVQAVYRNNPVNHALYDRTSTDPKIGPLFAVVTVDILTSHFASMLNGGLLPNDVVWIRSSHSGRRLIETSRLNPSAQASNIEYSIPLKYSDATIFISSDAAPLRRVTQIVLVGATILVLVVWGLAGLVGIGLLQRWRQQEATIQLEADQARLANEIDVAKSVESALRKTAFTDTLTGFPNRAALTEHVAGLLQSGERGRFSVLLADLDRFNVVNETLGHTAGDELLRALARRLGSRLSDTTFVGRLGGDEFVFVDQVSGGAAERLAQQVMDLLREPVLLSGQTLYMQASIGIVCIDESYQHPEELLRDADIAVYRAKHRGRARFETFDMAMRAEVARDAEFEGEIRKGLERGEFVPFYQPIIQIETGEVASFEALARWQSPKGLVPASEFIPFAESHGLAPAIDNAIMRGVCSQSTALLALFPGASIAVNVSAAELSSRDLPVNLERILREYKMPPLRLRLEITETAMMTHAEEVNATLERLQDMGIALLLDDFGTGYSSLAYLQRLPIVGLKIDKSFIEHVHEDERALEIVRSIVAIAEAFGLDTTAEGVETERQLEVIKDLGITFAQGFFFSQALEVGSLGGLRGPGPIQAEHF